MVNTPHEIHWISPNKRALAVILSAFVMLQAAPALAGGSGLQIETALNPFVLFFINFLMPIIGIAALVGAGVAFIAGGARAVGNVAVMLIGIAFVGFAVPMAASYFGLTQGALIDTSTLPAALLPGSGLW